MITPSQEIFEESALETGDKKGRLVNKYRSQHLISLIENFDTVYADSRFVSLIKKDMKTTLSIMKSSDLNLPFDMAVKCFSYRSRVHYLIRNIAGNRALHSYRMALKLLERRLSTPELIGFIESDRLRQSYCLSLFIMQAENLGVLSKKGLFHLSGDSAQELGRTLAEWHLSGAVHGDLKWSNILLQDYGGTLRFYFVDLDQTRLYDKPSLDGLMRDLTRFYSYGLEVNAEQWVSSEFLPRYQKMLPEEIRKGINFSAIKERALTDRKRKGGRTSADT